MMVKLAMVIATLCISAPESCPQTYRKIEGASELAWAFADATADSGVSLSFTVAVAWHESRFNPRAKSKVGAVGIMQVLPRYWGYRPCFSTRRWCATRQIRAGVQALSFYLLKCKGYGSAVRAYRHGKCGRSVDSVVATAQRIRRKLRGLRARWVEPVLWDTV